MYNKLCSYEKGCDLMDCMTISTFRSLEQQAIRHSKEQVRREQVNKVASLLMETFRQEPDIKPTNMPVPTEYKDKTSQKSKINYYA
jgi:hypothetical protein